MNKIKQSISNKPFTIKRILLSALFFLGCALVASVIWIYFALGPLRHMSIYIPNFTGFPFGERHYLILLQNNAELRPTGGFISSYADLTFHFGVFPEVAVHDVYSLKGYKDDVEEEAPYPMGDLLKSEFYHGYSFHDANWYPDLSKSAKEILFFYNKEFPETHIDGVITVNFSFIEHLITLFQPITLQDGVNITSNNLFATLEYEQNNIDSHNVEDIEARKNILSEIAPKLIKGIIFHPDLLPKASNIIYAALNKKDIALQVDNIFLQREIAANHWDNAFPKPEANVDLFAPVVANLGGMKSDRYIQRRYTKEVNLIQSSDSMEDRKLEITQRLEFYHPGGLNPPLSNTFVGYVRSYIPKDAEFVSLMDDTNTYEELGFMTVGKKITLNPGDRTEITFTYTLPLSYLDGKYSSWLYKQSGTDNTTYEVILRLPGDMYVTSKDMKSYENTGIFRGDITKDTFITADIHPDQTPPRVVKQEFIDYNRVFIEFNEPILSYDCNNKDNYSITDTDTNVPDVANKPRIERVECKDRQATIYTQGIRTQYGEFFSLELRNLRDRSNNIISPNPKTITVVQRFDKDKVK